MNALRIALGMFSGKIILNFGVQKHLRAFLNPIFTGRGRELPRRFPAETAARLGKPSCGKLISMVNIDSLLKKKPVVRYTEYNESFKKE